MAQRRTAIDLFAGAGGLTQGLLMAGFDVLAGIENDDLAVETYQANHRQVVAWNSDIRQVKVRHLRSLLSLRPGQLDLLAACPPCQGFSSIRTHNRKSVPDDRNALVLEVLRFTRWLLPRVVMVENVPGLRTDPVYRALTQGLKNMGYTYRSKVVDASWYGVPQRRKRLVLVASRVGVVTVARPSKTPVTVRSAFAQLAQEVSPDDPLIALGEIRSERIRSLIHAIPKDGGSRSALGKNQLACHSRVRGFHDVYGRMRLDAVSPTITGGCVNPSKGRFLHPEEDRAINLREAAVLQSFPSSYRFSLRRGKYATAELIGNAFPPEVVRRQAQVAMTVLNRHAYSGSGGSIGTHRH